MDSILDEHAALLAGRFSTVRSGLSSANVIAFTGLGNKLGGGSISLDKARAQQQGQMLGGNPFTKGMKPAEAAAAAAEARRRQHQLRLRGDHYCRPCTVDDGDDDIALATVSKADDGKQIQRPTVKRNSSYKGEDENLKPRATKKHNAQSSVVCIDLTDEKVPLRAAWRVTDDWSCTTCTFLNRPMALACGMCNGQRRWV
jgi:hypothetical protein